MSANQKPPRDIRAHSRDSRENNSEAGLSGTLAIKVIPNAPRTEIVGWLGDALKVKVHAPPVEGRANDALCEFLADTLDVPRRAVAVVRGGTSRQKLVRIDALSPSELKRRLAAVTIAR